MFMVNKIVNNLQPMLSSINNSQSYLKLTNSIEIYEIIHDGNAKNKKHFCLNMRQ